MPVDPDYNASPFNALPPVAVAGALVMFAVEMTLQLAHAGYIGGPGGVGWRLDVLNRFAFSGPLFQWMLEDPGRWRADIWWRFLTYPFVHGSFTHMLFGVVILAALAKFVGEVFPGLALAAIWFGSGIVGALALMLTGTPQPLFGAMPPDYGLVGALTYLLWQRARMIGASPWRAFGLIGVLLGLQVLFGLFEDGLGPQIVTEFAGFLGGFGLAAVLAPGGLAALQRALRRR